MTTKNFLSKIRGLFSASQSTDVSLDCRLTVGSPSGFGSKSLLKLVSVLVLILTISSGNVWGITTSDLETSATTTLEDGATYVIANAYNGTYLMGELDGSWGKATTTIGDAAIFTAHGSNSGCYLTCSAGRLVPVNSNSFSAYDAGTSNNLKIGGSGQIQMSSNTSRILRLNSKFRWYTSSTGSIVYLYKIKASCSVKPTVGSSLTSVSSTVNSITATVPISSIGGCNITENGLVYSTTVATPTVGAANCTTETTTACGGTAANKTVTISGLTCGQSYYVRGYATNAAGTSYTNVTTRSTSACPTYTVTYNAGTGTCGTAQWTQLSYGASTTLPSATAPATCSGWSFAGWCTSSAGSSATNTSSPGTILTGSYTPTSNVTLYAVYTKTEGGGGGGATLTKMVAGNTLADGDKIVVVASGDYNSVAMYQETTNTSYVQKWDCSTLNTTTVSADDKNWWTVTATEGGFYLGDATNGYLNMSSNNLYCDNDQSVWTLADLDDGTFRLQSNSRNLSYRHDLANAYWRMGGTSYGTSGQTILDIYKYSTGGGGGTTYYMTSLVCCTPLGTINGSFSLPHT